MSSDRLHAKSRSGDVETCGSKCARFAYLCNEKQLSTKLVSHSIDFSTQKEDEIEEYLRKRYADESVARRHFGDGGEEMSNEITQQTLLPAIK